MTSVQNHLQLLNGNNKLSILLLAILFIASCKTNDVPRTDITDKSPSVAISDTIEIPDIPAPDSLMGQTDTFNRKDIYNIAFILPFYLDSLTGDSLVKRDKDYFHEDAAMAVNFYLGAKLALDSLKKLGLNAKIHVFDSENNLGQMVEIRKSGKLDSMDMIIGPVYNGNIRYLAKWTAKKEIMLVNPLSPTANLTEDNPWFIQINPSIYTHIENLFELLSSKYASSNKIIIDRPIENEVSYLKLWETLAQRHNTKMDSIKRFIEFPKTSTDSIKLKHYLFNEEGNKVLKTNSLNEDSSFVGLLKKDKVNVLILNTIDKAFISRLNQNIFKVSEEYDIVVLGFPVWNALKDFRLDYVERYRLHYSSDYHVDTAFYSSEMYHNTIDSFYTEPGPYFIKGFDITLWMGKGLLNYGLDLLSELNKSQLEGIHNNFRLKNSLKDPNDSNSPVNYLENSYVHLLYIDDYQIKNARKTVKLKKQ